MTTATTNEPTAAAPISLVACHECDLLQRESAVPPAGTLRCCRCHAELYRAHPDSTARALAFTLTCVVLFFISNLYPIVGLAVNGDLVETTLLGAVRVLYKDGMWPIAGLVFATTFLMPLLQMTAMAYLLVPLQLNRRPYHAAAAAGGRRFRVRSARTLAAHRQLRRCGLEDGGRRRRRGPYRAALRPAELP